MKNIIAFITVLLMVTSCFKDTPKNEFSKVAGSWKIEKAIKTYYDSVGVQINEKTYTDRGYLMLNYNSRDFADNTFALSINAEGTDFLDYEQIAMNLFDSDRWDVSKDAKHLNFGFLDPLTGYKTLIIAFGIVKLNNKHMHISRIVRNGNSSLYFREVWEMKRAN